MGAGNFILLVDDMRHAIDQIQYRLFSRGDFLYLVRLTTVLRNNYVVKSTRTPYPVQQEYPTVLCIYKVSLALRPPIVLEQ